MNKIWTIHQLERKSNNGFVINVHWRLTMTDEQDGKTYYADNYGVVGYTQDENNEDFIPYEELTEEDIIGWVESYLGEERLEQMELSLTNQIENQKNPPVLRGLPWSLNQTTI